MSEIVCYRCGLGSIKDVKSALVRRALRRDGFRDKLVYVHQNDGVCSVVVNQRARIGQAKAAEYRSLRARIVRIARKARALWR